MPLLAQPMARLHFAGDYLSYRQAFMQGAVRSAQDVVDAIQRV